MENQLSGFILIDKPVGPTSHDIIYKLRKITGIKKIGHAGTLDPFASGLLIVAIGRGATKEISKYVKMDKEYIADVCLGAETDSYDRTGKKIEIENPKLQIPNILQIQKILKEFLGPQKQIPPMFSAKKVKGKKLYELARKGIEIERQPNDIEILNLDLLKYEWPVLKIKIKCSSGTYIRSLAYDIGKKLKCGAYLEELRRTLIEKFDVKSAVRIDDLNDENWESFLYK